MLESLDSLQIPRRTLALLYVFSVSSGIMYMPERDRDSNALGGHRALAKRPGTSQVDHLGITAYVTPDYIWGLECTFHNAPCSDQTMWHFEQLILYDYT